MRYLRNADAIMEDDPYAALDTLGNIKRNTLTANEEAYYALLYTQGQIKTWITVDSDTLVNIAYSHYRDKESGDLGIRANFYKAKVSYNAGLLQQAMKEVLNAYEMAKSNQNPYWIARSAELISDIYDKSYKFHDAELYTKEVITNYGLADKPINQKYAIVDLAVLYLNQHNFQMGMTILDSLYNACNNTNPIDSNIISYLYKPYIDALIIEGKFEKLNDVLITDSNDDFGDVLLESYIAKVKHEYNRSNDLISKALLLAKTDEDSLHVLYAKYQNIKSREGNIKLTSLSDSIIKMQGEIAEKFLQESVSAAKSDFYSEKTINLKARTKELTIYIIFGSITVILIFIIILILHQLRIKAKRAKLETAIASLSVALQTVKDISFENKGLNNRLTDELNKSAELAERLNHATLTQQNNSALINILFKERWTGFDILCREYFEKDDSDKDRKIILLNIKNELGKFCNKKNLEYIESEVNKYKSDIMLHLRAECTFMDEEDFKFMTLLYAGFTSKAVCYIMGYKYKYFYLKKSRLIKRINTINPPHKELFLDSIK